MRTVYKYLLHFLIPIFIIIKKKEEKENKRKKFFNKHVNKFEYIKK